MRLYTFVTLCACALYASAASIPAPEKKIDALDNVDLDNVDPELVDQPSVQDLDNSLRKVPDIPVKVIEAPVILDENSNEYIPDKDENINVKRIEIDLNNPGPPQRQEHETQNPGNYGEKERAVYQILQKAQEAQSIFTKGVKDISDSFYNLNKHSDEIPAVLENIKKLNVSFSNEIIELNNTIRTYLEPKPIQVDNEQQNNVKLNYVESKLQNLHSNFKNGVDILNEGFELLSILQEEDEVAKSETKTLVKEENYSVKDDAASSAAPSSSTAAPSPIQVPANGFNSFIGFFTTTVSNMLSNVTSVFQNNIAQPINIFQGFRPINVQPTQKPQDAKPPGAQSDEAGSAPVPAPTPAPSQWGPQAFFQQFQNSIQNLVNGGQGNQQNQQSQAPAQPAPSGPISQAFQNIVQFIQRPGQALSPQPANPSPVPQNPVSQSVPPKNPESVSPPQADSVPAPASNPVAASVSASPAVAQPVQSAAASQPVAVQQVPVQEQPAQGGPIQQLVQNNPIIKGIQSAVQRIQGNPNSADTPRNEVVEDEKKEKENLENKGGHGGSNNNQG